MNRGGRDDNFILVRVFVLTLFLYFILKCREISLIRTCRLRFNIYKFNNRLSVIGGRVKFVLCSA